VTDGSVTVTLEQASSQSGGFGFSSYGRQFLAITRTRLGGLALVTATTEACPKSSLL